MFKTRSNFIYFLSLFFGVFVSINTNAKDILIPSDIDGDSKATLFDYDSQQKAFRIRTQDIIEDLEVVPEAVVTGQDMKKAGEDFDVKLDKNAVFGIEDAVVYFHTKPLEYLKTLDCAITPTLKKRSANKPEIRTRSNNSRRFTKYPDVAMGDILYIKGSLFNIFQKLFSLFITYKWYSKISSINNIINATHMEHASF